MVSRPRRRAKDPFHHPDPSTFNYDLLLEAMALCRREAYSFQSACGVRNPAWRESQALIEQIDAVARLTRIEGAERVMKQHEAERFSDLL